MTRLIQYFDLELGWTTLYVAKSARDVMDLYKWMRDDDPSLALRTVTI